MKGIVEIGDDENGDIDGQMFGAQAEEAIDSGEHSPSVEVRLSPHPLD